MNFLIYLALLWLCLDALITLVMLLAPRLIKPYHPDWWLHNISDMEPASKI